MINICPSIFLGVPRCAPLHMPTNRRQSEAHQWSWNSLSSSIAATGRTSGKMQLYRRSERCNSRGHQIAEFAAIIPFIICIFFLPLVNLAVIPLRLGLVHNIVLRQVQESALTDKLSSAFATYSDNQLKMQLRKVAGVNLKWTTLALNVTSQRQSHPSTEKLVVYSPSAIPDQWLPNGTRAPCDYFLSIKLAVDIFPLVSAPFFGARVPGLNGPFTVTLEEISHWQNLGRDPASGQFFINE